MISAVRPRPVPRVLLAACVVLLAGVAAGFLATTGNPPARALVADLALLVTSAFAVAACALTWRALRGQAGAEVWAWVGAGCAVWWLGQLVWVFAAYVRREPPAFPSLADLGFLGIYVCLVGAVRGLARVRPTRAVDSSVVLDLLLVTFTVSAVAYEFGVVSRANGAPTAAAALVGLGWSVGGIAVLWLILSEMIRRASFPLVAGGPVALGLTVFSGANVVFGVLAPTWSLPAGNTLDLAWNVGFLLIAAAAAVAPRAAGPSAWGADAAADRHSRTVALLVGVAGFSAVAVAGALRGHSSFVTATLIALGAAILGLRLSHALRADRRYAQRLEGEVTAQTRTLTDALRATADAERQLRLLMSAIPDAILVLDRTGRIVDSNLVGRPPAQAPLGSLVGRPAEALLDADALPTARAALDAALRGELRRIEVPFRMPGHDERRTFSLVLTPVRAGTAVERVLVIARDVTRQRRTQAQLQQADRLAAMGQLVSGVAHEINNPAAIISGFAQTMLLGDGLRPDDRDMARMIFEEAGRIGRITQNLLAFARGGPRDRTLVDVNELVRRTYALREYHLTTRNITVSLVLDPGQPEAWASPSQLQQMLLNLFLNAEQALDAHTGARRIECRTRTRDGMVRIEVADTGPGVSPTLHGKIFDPFFTTKAEHGGTGLGLSICYGIVHDHGGTITLTATPGGGATFIVDLPRDRRPAGERPAAAPERAAAPGPGARQPLRVLLAEDEPALRRAVQSYFTRRDIAISAVPDGAAALAALAHDAFDAIVTDVRMPGMGGREFVARLRAERPGMLARLIFLTGDTLAPDTAALLAETGVPTLAKPFEFDDLEAVIRRVTRAAARSA